MRLAIVRQRYTPFGGAERFVERALGALAEQNTDLTLITRQWSGHTPAQFDVIKCDPTSSRLLGRASRDQAFAKCVQKVIRDNPFDLVQSHERIPGCNLFRAGDGVHAAWLEHRKPALSNIRHAFTALSPYHRYVLRAERDMYAHPALRGVICNSHMIAREIHQHYAVEYDRLHVIYNGVDTEFFHPSQATQYRSLVRNQLNIAQNTPVLLFVGSGYERKGVAPLLRAFACMQNQAAQLIIVGSDRKLKAMQNLAGQLGLVHRVHFLGPQQDVRPFYGAVDGFVLPTLYDPCPNAALEAMACGLPVVTSTRCGAQEWITPGVNGWAINIPDLKSLSHHLDALCELATQPSCHEQARQAVAHLTLEAMAEQLLKLYQRLLSQN